MTKGNAPERVVVHWHRYDVNDSHDFSLICFSFFISSARISIGNGGRSQSSPSKWTRVALFFLVFTQNLMGSALMSLFIVDAIRVTGFFLFVPFFFAVSQRTGKTATET